MIVGVAMTYKTNKKSQTTKLAVMMSAITLGVISGMVFLSDTSQADQEAISESKGLLAGGAGTVIQERSQQAFSIAVNDKEDAEIVATVNRGETTQLDVLVTPLIDGVSGDVEVYSSLPECGTVNAKVGCIPSGITVSINTGNKVSSPTHLPLAVTVSNDMPTGVYWYSVKATPLEEPTENGPKSAGYIAAFAIKVV